MDISVHALENVLNQIIEDTPYNSSLMRDIINEALEAESLGLELSEDGAIIKEES